MEFLRYLFLLLIISGSTGIGFILSNRYVERVRELNSLSNLINILQNKIKFTQKPLSELFEEISKINTNNNISQIFLAASKRLKTGKSEQAWSDAISEQKFFLNLTNEDLSLIEPLGNVLGKTDIDGQMSEINQFSLVLGEQIKKANEERSKNEKMCKSLGTIIGLAIAVIIF